MTDEAQRIARMLRMMAAVHSAHARVIPGMDAATSAVLDLVSANVLRQAADWVERGEHLRPACDPLPSEETIS